MPWIFERKYLVDDQPLGRGGMGEVYRATHLLLDVPVAIKFIDRETAERVGLTRRFQIEVHSLGQLRHPNIVELIDCGETEACLYNVMELVDGETLRTILRRAKKARKLLDMWTALYLIAQITRAMVAAHKLGIVHRDLKPENIMVAGGGLVRVLDFGLAKQLGPGRDLRETWKTSPGAAPGTPRYMAPEQVLGKPIDGRTDIYAIGILLYELIALCTPYSTHEEGFATPTILMAHHVHAQPRPINELVECPEAVWQTIRRCIQKDPNDRFQTTPELAAALRSAMRGMRPAPQRPSAAPRAATGETGDVGPRQEGQRATEPMPADFKPSDASPFAKAALGPRGTTRIVRPEIPWPSEGEDATLPRGTRPGTDDPGLELPMPPRARAGAADQRPRAGHAPNLPMPPSWRKNVPVPANSPALPRRLDAPPGWDEGAPRKIARRPRRPSAEPIPFYLMGVVGATLGVLAVLAFLVVRDRPAPKPEAPSDPPLAMSIALVPPAAPRPSGSVELALASEPAPRPAQPVATAAPLAAPPVKAARAAQPAPSARRRLSQPFPASAVE